MVWQRMLRPSSRAGVAPRWAGELRGVGFGIFSSQAQKCFVAGRFVSSQERGPPHGCRVSSRFRYFSATSPKVGNVPSARIGYNLILARPMPPPSVGKASFMRGHFDHRTNCSSTKHKEGL